MTDKKATNSKFFSEIADDSTAESSTLSGMDAAAKNLTRLADKMDNDQLKLLTAEQQSDDNTSS